MKLEDKARRYFVLLLSSLGTVALFLPFASSISPWDAIKIAYDGRGNPTALAVGGLAIPFLLLAPTLLVWELRQLRGARSTTNEIKLCYSAGAVSLLATAATTGWAIFKLAEKSSAEYADAAAPIFSSLLLIVTVLLLLRNRHAVVSSETRVETILLGAYLPNAFFCLLLFGFPDRTQLGVGAYMTAVVSIGYAAVIIMLLRNESRWLRSSP